MIVRLQQIRALQRARDAPLAFISAADGANIAIDPRAITAGFSDLTDLALHGRSGGLPDIFIVTSGLDRHW